MKKAIGFVVMSLMAGFALAFPGATSAQTAPQTRQPIKVSQGWLESQGAKLAFSSTNKMTANGKAAMQQQHVITVPNWSGSFTFQGTTFPYTMIGNNPPQRGGTTLIPTQLIPISFFFDEFVDQNGNNIVIDVSPIITPTLTSPNFIPQPYTSGFTQYGDAVQRAEFFNVQSPGWHNLLLEPRQLTPVQVEVPFGSSIVLETPSGIIFALIDFNFMISQLNTIVQLEPLNPGALAIALTHNALFYSGTPNNCCTLGFHTAFETSQVGPFINVQTFAFATWADEGIFVNPQIADVLALSHEISEWFNDPFVDNIVPEWTDPNGDGGCQNDLEVGDPVEGLPNPAFPVTIGGFTYHPQILALLPWFSRQTPNTMSIGGAFSYPNTTTLTSPSQPCPTTP